MFLPYLFLLPLFADFKPLLFFSANNRQQVTFQNARASLVTPTYSKGLFR